MLLPGPEALIVVEETEAVLTGMGAPHRSGVHAQGQGLLSSRSSGAFSFVGGKKILDVGHKRQKHHGHGAECPEKKAQLHQMDTKTGELVHDVDSIAEAGL